MSLRVGDPIVDELIHFSLGDGCFSAECNVCGKGFDGLWIACEDWAFRHYGEHLF